MPFIAVSICFPLTPPMWNDTFSTLCVVEDTAQARAIIRPDTSVTVDDYRSLLPFLPAINARRREWRALHHSLTCIFNSRHTKNGPASSVGSMCWHGASPSRLSRICVVRGKLLNDSVSCRCCAGQRRTTASTSFISDCVHKYQNGLKLEVSRLWAEHYHGVAAGHRGDRTLCSNMVFFGRRGVVRTSVWRA